jgi:DNA-binding NarL/FixJ family response regulator
MMKTIFIAPAEVRSPRWQQAFPDADVVDYEASLPADLAGHLLWVVMGDLQLREKLPRWVSAGARVVALTQTEDAAEAKQMLEWGASGYLHYLAAVPVLEQVRQVVQMGGLWLGVDLMRQLVFATASILQVPEVAPRQPLLEALTAVSEQSPMQSRPAKPIRRWHVRWILRSAPSRPISVLYLKS